MCDKIGPEITATQIDERVKEHAKQRNQHTIRSDEIMEEMLDELIARLHRAKLIEQKAGDETCGR